MSQQFSTAPKEQVLSSPLISNRIVSSTIARQATNHDSGSPEPTAWSSAVGHASTGKSGRVIERLQQQIDQITREKQLLRLKHEDSEKAAEMLTTRLQYLQDRNSNYESSHEANIRQLQRKERQVEDLREELRKEKLKTKKAEDAMHAASLSEDICKQQAAEARAIAQHKEAEYDVVVSCRSMDNERHHNGLEKIRRNIEGLVRQREEDFDKQRRLEIIAEQQRQTILQLEELTTRLNNNFKIYRQEIDSAVADLRASTSQHDKEAHQKLEEMRQVTGQMRWVMNVEAVINQKIKTQQDRDNNVLEELESVPSHDLAPKVIETSRQSSPARPTSKGRVLGIDFRRHRRKDSKPDR